MAELTDREGELIKLIAEGYSYKRITQELGITRRTIDYHLNHAKEKYGARTLANLVYKVMTKGDE